MKREGRILKALSNIKKYIAELEDELNRIEIDFKRGRCTIIDLEDFKKDKKKLSIPELQKKYNLSANSVYRLWHKK